MRKMVTEVEQNEKHPWHKLLGDLTANAFTQPLHRRAGEFLDITLQFPAATNLLAESPDLGQASFYFCPEFAAAPGRFRDA